MPSSFSTVIKRKFLAGLLISIPAIVTFLIIGWFFTFVDGLLEPFYYKILGYHLRGIGFISTIALIFLVGIISTNVFGRKVISYFDRIMLNIPVLKGVYTALKQLVDAFSPGSKSSSFKKFVIIEYPRCGVFAFGFLTNECVLRHETGEEESILRAVYIPTNNLYLGEIVLFRQSEVFYTNIPIDEGIKIILSGGIATPPVIQGGMKK
jgi:uncharacterized membrane protein